MCIDHFISTIEALADFNFYEAPALVFISKLRDELRLHGFSSADAEQLVLSMGVELGTENLFTVQQMNQLVSAYAKLIVNAQAALHARGFKNSEALMKIASSFTLTFK